MRQRILLPNGCYCSKLSVFPKDWNKGNPDLSKQWYISYRFHDPIRPRPKQVIIKGMNEYRTLTERRDIVKTLLEQEMYMLMTMGYNPFEKKYVDPACSGFDIDPGTSLTKALAFAFDKLTCTPETKRDIRSMLKYFNKAAGEIGVSHYRVEDIRKKHVRAVLERLSVTKKKWSSNLFNHYRKYLSVLFSELCDRDAIESNPIRDIAKQKTVKRIRLELTPAERIRVNDFLKSNYYPLWRFMQIFFHSGCRESEMCRLKVEDVNLANQEFKIMVMKGRSHSEQLRPVKDIILPLWQEIISECREGDYLFSVGLKPGPVAIDPRQVTRRWRTHVKAKLNIKADFYSLKHSNLDETAASLDIGHAQAMAGHTTPVVTMGYYTQGERKRQMEKLKKVGNPFT